jgi:predicted phage terminase large subunit-like protein
VIDEELQEERRLQELIVAEDRAMDFARLVRETFPKMMWGWFYDHLCHVLKEFLDATMRGESPRLIINVPPRLGKSEICTVRFPLWAMLNYAHIEIIACSYAQNLAVEFSRKARELAFHPYVSDIWGNKIKGGQFAAEKWSLNNGSSYQATSIGGSIVGKGSHILLIDDPHKNIIEADSAHHRNSIWEWYGSSAITRLSPGGGVIIIMQRWNELDLTGQLIRKEKTEGGDKWQVIEYQAIAEQDEPFRKKGESLLPNRFPVAMFKKTEAAMVARIWRANYQQRPTRKGGNVFVSTWFKRYLALPIIEAKAPIQPEWISSWDLRFGDSQKKSSSYVCGQIWMRLGAQKYLVDQVRGRWDFSQSIEAFKELLRKYPQCHSHLVENKANGPAMENVLKNEVSGIMLRAPNGDKVQRAEAAQPTAKAGNVHIPDENYNMWVTTWLDEMTTFPGSEDDDQVDCYSQAVNYMLESETSLEEVLCVETYSSSFGDDDY